MLALPKSKRPTEGCSGETHTIKPGETFRLTKCSCQGSQGCLFIAKKLKVGPLNNQGHSPIVVVTPLSDVAAFKKCTLKAGGDVVPHAKTNVCGTNGNHISTNFSIKCNVPSSTPTFTPTPTPTSRITVTPTFTPTPTGPVCITPEPVLNVKITCPNCNQGPTPTVAITPTETPIPPTPTFTITPTPTGGSQ